MDCTNLYYVIVAESIGILYLANRVFGSSKGEVPPMFDTSEYEIRDPMEVDSLEDLYASIIVTPNPHTTAFSEYVSFPKGLLGAIEAEYSRYSEATHVLVKFGVREETDPITQVRSNQLTVYFTPAMDDGTGTPTRKANLIDLGRTNSSYMRYNHGHACPPYVL